jgi:hypothetical protein
MGSFKEHGVLIYLSKDLYIGWIKLQADRNLGRSYAGLIPFVEGLYQLGYISESVYKEHIKKYSVPIDAKDEKTNPTATPEQVRAKTELDKEDRYFHEILNQWVTHGLEWQIKQFKYAEKFSDKLQSARDVLAKKEALKQ